MAVALTRKDEDRSLDKSPLAEFIKSYYAGRHKMIFGAGSVALGVALMVIVYATGSWGLFWIFLWVFMGLFGNGVHGFTKGWNQWSAASTELKAIGYDGPPSNASRLAADYSRGRVAEPPITKSTQHLASGAAQSLSSVTESTTRHLDKREPK